MGKYGMLVGLATNLVVTIGGSFWLGYQLNNYFELEKPYLTLALGLAGMASALIFTNKQMNKFNNKNEK